MEHKISFHLITPLLGEKQIISSSSLNDAFLGLHIYSHQ